MEEISLKMFQIISMENMHVQKNVIWNAPLQLVVQTRITAKKWA